MPATLVLAAHGTRSAAGSATTRALAGAVRAARPDVPVVLCFLDVASPSLAEALDALAGTDAVIVPLLLSAGYHVTSDIPAVVAGRARVTGHLGPDEAIVDAVADRLAAAGARGTGPTLLAAVPSSRADARAEVDDAAAHLAARLGRSVEVVPLGSSITVPDDAEVAVYLLAEGGFLDVLRDSPAAVVADPIGVHPRLVELIWARYDGQ